jgi:death on curing protein
MTGKALVWIEELDALALHERLLAFHGGATGVRDLGLLASALARPKQIATYDPQADLIDLTSAYTAAIVKNHPFVDGNKRTGFIVGVLFLELNGYRFVATEADAAHAVISLAAGKLTDIEYADFLRANTTPE